jgi:branched-chain amino acid transport system substrate-binding protein
MFIRYQRLLYALGVVALLTALSACGSTTGSTIKSGTVCIGTELPTTGTDGSEGQPAENGVDLAVMQNQNLGSGIKLEVRNFNDVSPQTGLHDPPTGAQNVQQMLTTSCILAFVGPFNSSVAGAEVPVAATGGLAMISPSNTNPGITLQQYADQYGYNYANMHPAGKPNIYFRIPANDVVQGKVDADYMYDTLSAHHAYIIDDTEAYGKGLADFFEKEYSVKGGTVLGHDEISAKNASQLPALAAKIVNAHPDAVFYGGVTSEGGGLLKAQLVQAGFTGPMVGGDGIAEDSAFLTQAGAGANNTHCTVAAPDLSTFTGSAQQKFINDYKAQFNADPGPYSANSYDAGMIIINAIKHVIAQGQQPNRANVRDAIQHISYTGVTGHIAFDEHGDNSGDRVFSVYAVQNGKWVFVKSIVVSA